MTYRLLTLCGNVDIMNFLIPVVPQCCEACLQRVKS